MTYRFFSSLLESNQKIALLAALVWSAALVVPSLTAPIPVGLLPTLPGGFAPAPFVLAKGARDHGSELLKQAQHNRIEAGTDVFPPAAFELLYKAARLGLPEAQYELGREYGRKSNYDEGMKWLSMAAKRGHLESQKLLCLSYALGRGPERDSVTAYAWCTVAEHLGLDDAKEALQVLRKFITTPQLTQAQALAKEFEENMP